MSVKPELKIVQEGAESHFSSEEIQKLITAGVIRDSGKGYYEFMPGNSWPDVDKVLKPKKGFKLK